MKDYNGKIYFGSILLEKNRWTSREPSYRVSPWLESWRDDGFDGVELWENHALRCDLDEFQALERKMPPVAVYNSYVRFDNEYEKDRQRAADMAVRLRAKAVKFNFGNDLSLRKTYIHHLKSWAEYLPEDCRLLCECHPGTIMEDPEIAGEVLDELGSDRYQAIIHPLNGTIPLEQWFERLGSRITHAHIQMRDENNQVVRLSNDTSRVQKQMYIMKEAGYAGSYTIEFAEGTRTHENIEELYQAAVEDLHVLKELVPRG